MKNWRGKHFVYAALAIFAATLLAGHALAEKYTVKHSPKPVPAKYAPIVRRNIFGFMPRGKTTAEQPLAATQTTGIAYVETPPMGLPSFSTQPFMQQPSFSLTGTIRVGDSYKAIIENKASKTGQYISELDKVGDYTATKITLNEVVLKKGNEIIVLKMERGSASAPLIDNGGGSDLTPGLPPDFERLPLNVQPRIGR